MKKIIYTRPDGGLSIFTPAINTHPIQENITEDAALQRAWGKLPPEAINPQAVEADAIPVDRTFRNAWAQSGETVVHDMQKCRDIQREKMRYVRGPLLVCLDADYMKALEANDRTQMNAIALQKQALRDVTKDPAIEAAQTPEELKEVWPVVLNK